MLKGRKFLSIFILGITSFVLLLSVSIPIAFKTKAHVPYTLAKTTEQFTDSGQLGKWTLPANGIVAKLVSAKPGTILLNFSGDGADRDYRFQVTRDPKKRNSCIVTILINNTFWKRMIDPDPLDDMVIKSTKNLEIITNNTILFYGYPIYKSTITDSTYLYISTVINPAQKTTGTQKLFDSLFQFARSHKINNPGKRIFSSQSIGEAELRIYAGIVINSKATINPVTGITVKKMRPGKTLLVADFKGKYKDVGAAYKALEQYKRDYQLASMEMAFEEFQTPGNSYTPEDSVMVKVCYPIY